MAGFFTDTSHYVFEEDDVPYKEDLENKRRLQENKMRMVSSSNLKSRTSVPQLEKNERIRQKPSSVAELSPPTPRLATSKVKFMRGVNAVRAIIRMRNLTYKTKDPAESDAQDTPRSRSAATLKCLDSLGPVRLPRSNSLSSRSSPLKRARHHWQKLSQLGASRISVTATNSTEDAKALNVQTNVIWAAKYLRKSISRFRNKGDAIGLFRKASRRILIVLKWLSLLDEQAKTVGSDRKTFTDLAPDFEESSENIEERSGLAFDPRMFKAKRHINLTEETKRILTTPCDCRTADEVAKVQVELQMMPSFSEYPLYIQEKLCRVAWYQELQPRRLILREGHLAESFYFIISGLATVKKMIKNQATGIQHMTTLGRLKGGQCFGEIAIIHRSKRTASVETSTSCHILLIGGDAFVKIFLNTGGSGEPEHITWCRHLPFMKNWPVDKLAESSQGCLFHFFRRRCVVVSDSNKDEWIYVVKSGSCVVLKKLKAVEPQNTWIRRVGPGTVTLRQLGTGNLSARTNSNYPKDRPVPVPESLKQAMTEFEANKQKGSPRRVSIRRSNSMRSTPSIAEGRPTSSTSVVSLKRSDSARIKRTITVQRSDSSVSLKRQDSAASSTRQRPGSVTNRQLEASMDAAARDSTVLDRGRCQSARVLKPQQNTMSFRSTVQEYTNPGKTYRPEQQPTCFIQLKKIVPGQAFGLEFLEFENEPIEYPSTSVSLVSNGAELVMISKALFLEHANECVQRQVRETIQRYPREETLQQNLQTQLNWKMYREQLIGDFMDQRLLCSQL